MKKIVPVLVLLLASSLSACGDQKEEAAPPVEETVAAVDDAESGDSDVKVSEPELLNDSIGRHVIKAKVKNSGSSVQNVDFAITLGEEYTDQYDEKELKKVPVTNYFGVTSDNKLFSGYDTQPLTLDKGESVEVAIYPYCDNYTPDNRDDFTCLSENGYNPRRTYRDVTITATGQPASSNPNSECLDGIDIAITEDKNNGVKATLTNNTGEYLTEVKAFVYALDENGDVIPDGAVYGREHMRPFGMYLETLYFTTMKPGASQEKEWLGTAQWKPAGAWCVIDTAKQ